MILGLDISTSITGYSIIDETDGSLVELGHFDLYKNKGTMWDKIDEMKKELICLNKKHEIKYVFIEEPLSKFSRGRSSSNTISLLMRFNGILSYIIHEFLGITPAYFSPSEARKLCGLKMRSKAACKRDKIPWKPQKEQAFDQMNARAPFNKSYNWPLKRTGKLKDHCYDEMDSFVVCLAGYKFLVKNKVLSLLS